MFRLVFKSAESKISIGRVGITIKESVRSVIKRSTIPPRKPARRPTKIPMTEDRVATIIPMINEFLMDSVKTWNISWPRELVPIKCSAEGFKFRIKVFQSLAEPSIKRGTMNPITSRAKRRITPIHNLIFQYLRDLNMAPPYL
jgi:hypothetical protein